MNNQSLVSIITPSYNSSAFIAETIKSVQVQTYTNWEMLIVDDCSTDNSVEIIKQFAEKDDRIKYIALKTNVGAAEARNAALRKAKGKYIAFLDSDDLWYPEKLEKHIKFMNEINVSFTFSAYEIMEENGTNTGKIINVPEKITYKKYLRNTIIGCLTVVIDIEKTGYFEMPNIKSSHDMALWLSILKKGQKAYGIQEVLAKYRLVSTSNTAKKWKAAKDVWKVYRKIEKLNLLYSMFNFVGYSVNAILKRL